ncbi:MAG: GNAT family N-acetyltransferase [Burkholderiales bacterium]|nr:GNAT family N-acetyltransferase [Burkholderiales bacterium]
MGIEIAKILSEAEITECINLTKQAVGYMASIGFMLDSTTQDYLDYWVNISNNLNDNNILFLYKINNKIVGTVQLIISCKLNGKHRAQVAKLIVDRSYQNQGIASKLMLELEKFAFLKDITLLVLDTQTDSYAEKFYLKHNWMLSGLIPNYAKMPNGDLSSTSVFHKIL